MEWFKKLLILIPMLSGLTGLAQECPEILFPQNGATNVPVDGVIRWTDTDIDLITSWAISIGITPNGGEFALQQSTGRNTEFPLPCGIPNNTRVYVDLYIFTLTQGFIPCSSFSFTTEAVSQPPECRTLTFPEDGDQGVNPETTLTWACSPSATGYLLSVGTASGNYDIFEDLELNSDQLSYPFRGDPLPENEDIYVRVVPFNEQGRAGGGACEETTFRTGELIQLPGCTRMVSPANGEQNVPLNTTLTWQPVDNATGYRVFIGTSPNDTDILAGENPFRTNSTGINFLEPNTIYYVRIVPVNDAGDAIGCTEIDIFSTILGCSYILADGTVVDDRPPITFPSAVGSCDGSDRVRVTATDPAEGYRWFQIPPQGPEFLLGTSESIELPGEGEYRLEIFNVLQDPNDPDITFECISSQAFSVTQSEPAEIEGTEVSLGAGVISIEVEVSGIGDYEFALSEAGPYQESNRFTNLPIGNYTVYVRDKKGCGITEVPVEPDLTLEGFPKFFTPNGDDNNDFWKFILPPTGENPIRELYIFDRYGKLLAQVDPLQGWDGTFNGKPMPSSDYWYRAVDKDGRVIQGHFALKR